MQVFFCFNGFCLFLEVLSRFCNGTVHVDHLLEYRAKYNSWFSTSQVVFNIGQNEILRGTRAATLEATAERTERGCLPNSLHIQQIHAG
jgi:hypothetical protein